MAKNASRRFLKNLGYFLGLIIAAGLCFVSLLMISGQFEEGLSTPPAEGIAPLQPGQSTDFAALQQAFGGPLPCLPGYSFQGQATNEVYNGQNVRKVALQYEGFRLTAVRPAFAAPLLLQEELSLCLDGDATIAGLPAALAEGRGAHCLYFSTEDAAYSLYAPAAGRDSFLSLAEKITLIGE